MNESLPQFVREPDPNIYLEDSYVVVDFETTNKEHGSALEFSNSLLLACWSVSPIGNGRAYRYCWADEFQQYELIQDIRAANFVVAHHAKFELGWLRRCGIDLRKVLTFDTMIGEKVIAGNRKLPLSLDATAARRGLGGKASTVSSLIKAGVCPSQIPQSALREYCEQDVALTEQIFLQQRTELQELGLLPVAYSRNLVTPVLADIEFNGMTLDATRVTETFSDYAQKYASLAKELQAAAGGINPKSPKQMREFLYGTLKFTEPTDYKGRPLLTAGGELKADKATIASLKAVTPEQKEFQRIAVELAKLKVPLQNLKKMDAICKENPSDPRVFATFNQTVTATDRLSSTGRNGGFQFHNFDRAFKPLFRSRSPGRIVCEADAPQLEFRFAAFLGNDAQAIRDILEGVDIHANTAAVFGISRQAAKARTFAPLYGATSGDARTVKYRDFFRQRYSGIFGVQQGWTYDVARDKYLRTPWGMRFYWPDTEIKSSGYVTNTTAIFNYPVQAGATAEIIPFTLRLIWDLVGYLGDSCTLVNTIHDSVIADVSTDALPEYTDIVKWAFSEGAPALFEKLYGLKITVPLGVGIKAAEFWGEGSEQKYEVFA